MERKIASGIMLTLLLASMFTISFSIQPVKANGTIYIRADGSIDPPTAPIQRNVDIYTFTDDIYDSVVVERDNIVVDGAGYKLQASSSIGVDLTYRKGVTVKDLEIRTFFYGIFSWASSNISIIGNIIVDTDEAICLCESSNSVLRGNVMVNNRFSLYVDGESLSNFIHDVDASNTVDGKPVYYWINQSDRTVPLDAGYVAIVNSTRVAVQNLDLSKNGQGILLVHTINTTITQNSIKSNLYGIFLDSSFNNTISRNDLIDNNNDGIWLRHSSHNSISGNNIAGSFGRGIYLSWSNSTSISGNSIANNYEGIEIRESSNNSISGNNIRNNHYGINLNGIPLYHSSNNSIIGNNVTNNSGSGLLFQGCSDNNKFYHNNFISNFCQASILVPEMSIWDDSYPSGGNFWNNYNGIDFGSGPYQNETGADGIGDTPFVIDAHNQDNYPLMIPWGCSIDYQSNTTITDASVTQGSLSFLTEGPEGTTAYINVTMPCCFNNTAIRMFIDEVEIEPPPFPIIITNGTHYFIYAEFRQSIHYISIKFTSKPWDINGPTIWVPDWKCDIRDIAIVAVRFGAVEGDQKYDRRADITGPTYLVPDLKIDIRDIALVAKHFGETYS